MSTMGARIAPMGATVVVGDAPYGRRGAYRWTTYATAALLCVALSMAWGPLAELVTPGRAHPGAAAEANRPASVDTATGPGSIDADAVADAARHQIVDDPADPAALTVEDPRYIANFDVAGFRLAPSGVRAGPDGFAVSLQRVARTGDRPGDRPGDRLGASGPWTADGNVASRSVATGVTERVTARDATLEWDVVLDRAPTGSGDLVVEAEVSGATDAARRVGSELVWSVDGDAVTMGELVVKDAAGREVHRALPRPTATGLALDVPAAVLDTAAYPLVIDPVIGPEFPVAGPAGARNAGDAVAAFDGTDHLVVWSEPTTYSHANMIAGVRVAPDGTVVDATKFRIGPGRAPSVAFDGTNFLVAYEYSRGEIRAARISPEGVMQSPGELTLVDAADGVYLPRVSFDGANFLVAWARSPAVGCCTRSIVATRVTPAGAVLDPAGVVVGTGVGGIEPTDIAFDGTNHLVVWTEPGAALSDPGRVLAARVSPAAAVLDPTGIMVAGSADSYGDASAAVVGPNVLVTWSSNGDGGVSAIFGSRVTPGGSVLDPGGFRISHGPGFVDRSQVGFDGTNALVVWHTDRFPDNASTFEVFGARVTPDGEVLDATDIPMALGRRNYNPELSFDGTDFLLTWSGEFETTGIHGVRLSGPDRTPDGDAIVIARKAEALEAEVAFDGTNYLVAWNEVGYESTDIYASRVSPTGRPLDGPGILVANTADRLSPDGPAVSFDGTNYLVVWNDVRGGVDDLYGARISAAGVLLDPQGFIVSRAYGPQNDPEIAFDGTNHLVVWEDHRTSGDPEIWATRVSPAGTVGNEILVSRAPGPQVAPDVASDGNRSLITWEDGRTGSRDINGTLIGVTGEVLTPGGVPISSASGDQKQPSVAWNGGEYLVVWTDQRTDPGGDIYGSRVTTASSVVDPSGIAISTAPDRQSDPATVANGAMFQVVWTDRRSGTDDDVYGARVDAGVVQDPVGFAVASGFKPQLGPALVDGAGSDVAVIWNETRTIEPSGGGSILLRHVGPK